MNKIAKILLWTCGIVLALLLLLTLVAGPLAKGYVNRHGHELTGRKVSVGHVGLNLFSGNLCIRDLTIYEDDGRSAFASFDTLDVSARLLALPFKTLHLSHITLAGLHANIQQNGEHFNFSSLLDHFASDQEPDTTPSDWTLKLYNIRLSHASVDYDDLLNHKGIHLPDVNLRVPGFVMGGDEASEGGLNIGFAEGGRLNIDANYDSQRQAYTLQARLTDFALENLRPLVTDIVRLDHIGGSLDATVNARGRTDNIMQSRIGGTVGVSDLDLRSDGSSVASLAALQVVVDNISLADNNYSLQSVTLDGLNATYAQWTDHNTLSDLLVKSEKSEPSSYADSSDSSHLAPSTSQPLPSFKVGRLAVTNCAITYDDHTLPDEFHFPVTNLAVEATNLSNTGGNNARLRATLPGGGHLTLNWDGTLDDWKRQQQLFLSVKGLSMRQLSPWAVAYTGQPIEGGIFGLTTRLTITNSELDNQNKIDIYKAQVGSRRKDVEPQMKIPLKTALYILKDKDDKILIDMPVKGNVDSPEFNYMKLVWKTLGNLLVKVATSPARALGNALGMNGDELEFVAVEPGQHSLTSEQYHQLSALAAIAQTDSLMVLTLEQHMPATDDDSIRRHYQHLDMMVSRYMTELGVPARQLLITAGDPTVGKERTGYAVSSEMRIE